MKKIYLSILLAICFFVNLNAQEVVSSTFLVSYDQSYFVNELEVIFAQNGVDLYRVNYTTTNLEGAQDTASGLVCIPQVEGFNLPLVSYGHGTVASRYDVPSYLSGEEVLPALYSSMGVVSVAADYLGLGDNDGIHPYVHADSEASASYDLIIAIEGFLRDEMDIKLNDQLYITGYSQGGHSAMALHRYIETETDMEVNGSFPMSGPYSISTAMRNLLVSEEEYLYVAYLVATAISYQEVYGNIYPNEDMAQFFKPQFVPAIQKYMNEETDLFELNEELIGLLVTTEGGSFPKRLVQDDLLESILTDENHPVNVALRDNDVYDWAPEADTRLLYCMADDQVAFENSIIARDKMIENGATQVFAIDLNPDFDHGECVTPAATNFILYLLTVATATSSSDLPQITFEVYPNPTQNDIKIESEDLEGVFNVTIFDLSGAIKKQVSNLRSGDVIETNLNSGQYLMTLSNKEGKYLGYKRIVISN